MNRILLPEFSFDASAIERRLDREHPGYGVAFIRELTDAFRAVTETPRQFSPTEDGVGGIETREFFIARFNYRVIYAIDGEDLVFVALAHAHQLPGRWNRRWLTHRSRFQSEDERSRNT